MAIKHALSPVSGVILAGGEARRMGGNDKGLVQLAGRPMVEHVLAALRPQVEHVLINANRNHDAYRRFGVPVIADTMSGFQGPLAGMAAALRAVTTPLLVTVPCDSPFVPDCLVARLTRALDDAGADLATAHDGTRMQPVFALLRVELAESLELFLAGGGRKIDRWFADHRVASADFSDQPDTFLNVNTAEEVARIEGRLREPRCHAGP